LYSFNVWLGPDNDPNDPADIVVQDVGEFVNKYI